MRSDIKEKIIGLKRSAQECADLILKETNLTQERFNELFDRYLCYKFMLDPEELDTDDFYALCQKSAEKSSKLPKGLLDAAELASKCGGATTAMNKKVLFIMAVKREFHISITAEESVKIEKYSQLKQLILGKIGK